MCWKFVFLELFLSKLGVLNLVFNYNFKTHQNSIKDIYNLTWLTIPKHITLTHISKINPNRQKRHRLLCKLQHNQSLSFFSYPLCWDLRELQISVTVISFLLLCSTLQLFSIKQHRIKGKSFVGLLLYCFRFLNSLNNGYVSLSQQLVISLHRQVIWIAFSLFDS